MKHRVFLIAALFACMLGGFCSCSQEDAASSSVAPNQEQKGREIATVLQQEQKDLEIANIQIEQYSGSIRYQVEDTCGKEDGKCLHDSVTHGKESVYAALSFGNRKYEIVVILRIIVA